MTPPPWRRYRLDWGYRLASWRLPPLVGGFFHPVASFTRNEHRLHQPRSRAFRLDSTREQPRQRASSLGSSSAARSSHAPAGAAIAVCPPL